MSTPGRGAERRRPDPPRALQPRRQHARRRLGAALGRLSDPGGGARGADPVHHDDRRRCGGRARDRQRTRRDRALPAGADRCRSLGASVVTSSRSRRSGRTCSSGSPVGGSTPACPASSSCSRRPAGCCRGRCRSASRRAGSSASCSIRSAPARARSRSSSRASRSTSSVRSATASGSTSTGPLLVGGGIGVAPFPYLSEALEQPTRRARLQVRAARRSCRARSERRGRDRPGARHRRDAARPRRARVRSGADARGGPRALSGRAARLGGADGLRVRRVLRLRRRNRRRAEKVVRGRTGACASPERERLPRRAHRAGRRGAVRRVRDEDGHARTARRQRTGSHRRDGARDAQRDRSREPGTCRVPWPNAAAFGRHDRRPDLGFGRRFLRARLRRDVRATRARRRRVRRVEPQLPERRRSAGVGGGDRPGLPRQ